MTTIVSKPNIEKRRKTKYVGLRVRVPMRGMSKEIVNLRKQAEMWCEATGVKPAGAPFVRYYVIDMAGEMDIEYGIPVGRVGVIRPPMMGGELPAGEYACLVYSGSGLAGNKALIEWARANGVEWDRWDDPRGDAFASRYERFLTDPAVEPRKKNWKVEVAIKISKSKGR